MNEAWFLLSASEAPEYKWVLPRDMKDKGSILVVDDNSDVSRLHAEFLREDGYAVLEAATGRQGLEMARTRRPDLVLLDVRLPDLGGREVCRQIKGDAELRDMLVVLCSGEAISSADKVQGLVTGADEYLTKPVDLEELRARIRTLMRLRETVRALRASEEHHRRLIDILPDAFCMFQGDRITNVNARAVALMGYGGPAELIGKKISELAAAAEYEKIQADIRAARNSGVLREAEYTLLKKNGEPVRVELSATHINGPGAQSAGWVCVVRDITERKAAQEKIHQLLSLLDQAHDVIIVRDLGGRIQYFNKGAERALGWTAAEVQGRNMNELLYEDPKRSKAAQDILLRTGKWHGELIGFSKAQKPMIFQCHWTLVGAAGADAHLVVCILTDITQRKLAEEKLHEQEALSQRILSTTLEGFCRLNQAGQFLDANEACCRMIGCPREVLLGMSLGVQEHRNNPFPDLTLHHLHQSLKSGGARFDTQLRRQDGSRLDVEVVATILKQRENQILLFLRDNTDRLRAENLLRASEEKFRQFSDHIQQVFWMTDPLQQELIYVSRGYEEIWGRSCQSLYASPADRIEAIHPEDRPRIKEAIRTKQAQGTYDEVYRIFRPDGSIRWIQDRAFPIRNEVGKVYRIAGIADDITKRKELWDALSESEARKGAIMRVALDGIVTIDHAGKIVELNAAAEKIFTHRSAKLVGRNILELIPPSLQPWFEDGLARSFTGEKGPAAGSRIEMPILRSDGSRFPAELTITRIRLKGQPNFTLYVRDITQRKRAEEELLQFPRRIIEIQEAERQAIARELHDGINQILASVKMRLKKVEQNLEGLSPAARVILSRCDQLLVKALQENRRISHDLRPSDLDHFGLFAACRNFCSEFQLRTDLAVQCRIPETKHRLASITELNLFRILQEVLNNIEKHAQARNIKVEFVVKGQSVTLKIADDGRGFDLKKAGPPKKRGHGFGLTNIQERAKVLGGTCKILPGSKKGTTITVTVPLVLADQPEADEKAR